MKLPGGMSWICRSIDWSKLCDTCRTGWPGARPAVAAVHAGARPSMAVPLPRLQPARAGRGVGQMGRQLAGDGSVGRT
jgi:hypothetical protein